MAELTTITISIKDIQKKVKELKNEGCYQFIIEVSEVSDTCKLIYHSDDTGSVLPDIKD
jgi:hypothetical protein